MHTLKLLARAVRHPAETPAAAGLARALLRTPRVFDVVSYVLQLRHASRVARIHEGSAGDPFYEKVKDYNAGVTQKKLVSSTRRAELLYQLLTTPARPIQQERLLIVGARNVQELYLAWLYGYRWSHIHAIDLYSTMRKIVVMNMEELGIRDESFDAIVMANTLSYAKDTFRCLAEMARVLTPGGRMVFSATYYPGSRDWPGNLLSGSDIRAMLKQLGFALAAYVPLDKMNSLGGEQTAHVFGVEKKDSARPGFDRVDWL